MVNSALLDLITLSLVHEYFNPFQANDLFLYPFKTSEKKRFSDILMVYRSGTLAWNRVANLCCTKYVMLINIFREIDFSRNDVIKNLVFKRESWWDHFEKGLFQIRSYLRIGYCLYFWVCDVYFEFCLLTLFHCLRLHLFYLVFFIFLHKSEVVNIYVFYDLFHAFVCLISYTTLRLHVKVRHLSLCLFYLQNFA